MSQQPEDIQPSPTSSPDDAAQGTPAAPARDGTGLFFPLVLVAAAAALAAIIYFKPFSGDSRPTLKSLALEPLAEEGSKLALEDLKGQVVLLNFWGTWCPPCLKEFPEIVALEKQYRQHKSVRVVAVSCGAPQNRDATLAELKLVRETTQAFLDQRGVDVPMYLDPGSKTREAVNEAIGFEAYPTTVLLDREHRIYRRWVGTATKSDFEAAIEELLNRG